MASNERVKAAVLEVVDNQLRDKPSATRQSYQRLLKEGFSKQEAREFIGVAVTGIDSSKVKCIRHDPRITLLVSNDMSEYETWVAFDGTANIRLDGAIELIDQLVVKYWDLSDPKRKATLDSWKRAPEQLCVIELVPSRIRTYGE